MYGEDHLPKLVGLKVDALEVSDEESTLVFRTDQGPIAITTYADCCSETWFADIVGVSSLVGHRITAAVDIEFPDDAPDDAPDDGRTRQEYDAFYGIKLTTDAPGDVDIVYRNSGNGYYGGSIESIGPVSDQDILDSWNLRPITADWRAGTPVRD